MLTKEIIGGMAVAVGMVSYALYIWQIRQRVIKPHLFTWVVWGTMMSIGFAAQYVEGAGPGAWNSGVCAVITFVIAGMAYFHGEKNITRSDWAAFIFALSAIPVWAATHNPLWAVVIVSVIDSVAFYPTLRKSWLRPDEEGAVYFSISGVQFALSIFALENMNLTTVLYPAVITGLNALLVVMLLYRRRVLA